MSTLHAVPTLPNDRWAAPVAPLYLGSGYLVEGILGIDMSVHTDENGMQFYPVDTILEVDGKQLTRDTETSWTSFHDGYKSYTHDSVIDVLGKTPAAKVKFVGRIVGYICKDLTDRYSHAGPALKAMRESASMPAWFLAQWGCVSEEFIDAYEADLIDPSDSVAKELFDTILEHGNSGLWGDELYCEVTDMERYLANEALNEMNKQDLTISSVAEATDMVEVELMAILHGESTIHVGELARIAKALGVAPSELMRRAQILADAEEGN